MAQASGLLAYVGWGKEVTWGTTVARAKFAELVSEGLMLKAERGFAETTRGASKRRWFNSKRHVEGDIVLEPMYEGFEELYKFCFGAVTTTPLTAPAVQHEMTLINTSALGSLSVEVERDQQAFLYAGCKIGKLSFSGQAKKLLQMTASLLGKEETQVAATGPTYPAEQPIKFSDFVCKIDAVGGPGVAIDLIDFSVDIDNALDPDRVKLGDTFIKEPTRTGHRLITGVVTIDFEDTTQHRRESDPETSACRTAGAGRDRRWRRWR